MVGAPVQVFAGELAAAQESDPIESTEQPSTGAGTDSGTAADTAEGTASEEATDPADQQESDASNQPVAASARRAAVAPRAASNSVFNVADDTELADALDKAQSGDVIKLAAGEFAPFSIPDGVTIEGTMGATRDESTVIVNKKADPSVWCDQNAPIFIEGDVATLKNLWIDNTARTDENGYNATALLYDFNKGYPGTKNMDVTLDNCHFVGSGEKNSCALYLHFPTITVKNCTFENFEQVYCNYGDGEAAGNITFTGNTFLNVKVPFNGYWGLPYVQGKKITFTGNTIDPGSWGSSQLIVWDYAQFRRWTGDEVGQGTGLNVEITGNTLKGDCELQVTHANMDAVSNIVTDMDPVYYSLVEIAGDDVEGVKVLNADGTPALSSGTTSDMKTAKNGKNYIYSLPEGNYTFQVTHKAAEEADPVVTEQKITLGAPNSDAPGVRTLSVSTPTSTDVAELVDANGTTEKYSSFHDAVAAAKKGDTVKLLNDIHVSTWQQVSALDGVTIDGGGHTLAVDKIESEGNGNYLLYGATNTTVKNLKVSLNDTDRTGGEAQANGFDLKSGALSGVTVSGATHGLSTGTGEVSITGCAFENCAYALYPDNDKENPGKLVVTDSSFTGCDSVASLYPANSTFTGNKVSGGWLSIVHGSSAVTGNEFTDGSSIMFVEAPEAGKFSRNAISADSFVTFDGSMSGTVDLNRNYWGGGAPSASQLPLNGNVTVDVSAYYLSADMNRLNTDPFHVTFDDNVEGTENAVVEVKPGDAVAKPADPEREGYTFAGWYSDKALTQPYDFSASVTGDLTLYAKWTVAPEPAEKVTVTFDDGVGGVSTQEVEAGSPVARPADPTHDGWTFVGWFATKGADGTLSDEWDFSTPVTADMTLYGGWVPVGAPDGTKPTAPREDDGAKSVSDRGKALPQTGDSSAAPIAAAAGAGIAAIAGAAVLRRRNRREQ